MSDWENKAIDLDYILPCSVKLPPATTIKKGCSLRTLIIAIKRRGKHPLDATHFKPTGGYLIKKHRD